MPAKSALRPLTPRQRLAATLVGQGRTKKDAAAEVSVSRRSLSAWAQRDDFRALVQQARDGVLAVQPTAKATLEAALTATKSNGDPDWQARVQAARVLVTGKGGKPEAEKPHGLTVHSEHLDPDDDGGARPDPRTAP